MKEQTQKPSPSQLRALTHGEGPALVLAGPGSGKTFVITSRVRDLVCRQHISPAQILVITFSRAAAETMKRRYAAMSPSADTGGVIFGTFHAVFFQILKAAYHYSAANILREEQKAEILRELIARYHLEANDRRELMENLASEISRVKNESLDLSFYYSACTPADTFRKIFTDYRQTLRDADLIDFDDMLVYTYELLSARPDILQQWRSRFRHILVDEFQDINLLQYKVVQLLAAPANNLFAVGDDDQSIYRFRGAKPEILLGFTKDYPQAAIIHLEENYRSTDQVIAAAGQVIAANKVRYSKRISGMSGPGSPVQIVKLRNVREESQYLVTQIRKAVESGLHYSDLAILTRTNTAGRYIATQLRAWQIPFTMPEHVPDLFDHWVAQDLLSYVRFAVGGRSRQDFLQIMNRPLRYISRDCVDTPQVSFDRLCMWYEDKPWMVRRLTNLEQDMAAICSLRPYAAVNYIRRAVGYDDFLREYAVSHNVSEDELLDIAGELQESAAPYASFAAWSDGIEKDREKRSQENERRRNATGGQDVRQDQVLLGTLHASKGLEFAQVFIPDVNEGMLPYHKASLESDIEEERRLFYVGMTRAKKVLHITYVQDRFGKEQVPSRFLMSLIRS